MTDDEYQRHEEAYLRGDITFDALESAWKRNADASLRKAQAAISEDYAKARKVINEVSYKSCL